MSVSSVHSQRHTGEETKVFAVLRDAICCALVVQVLQHNYMGLTLQHKLPENGHMLRFNLN